MMLFVRSRGLDQTILRRRGPTEIGRQVFEGESLEFTVNRTYACTTMLCFVS